MIQNPFPLRLNIHKQFKQAPYDCHIACLELVRAAVNDRHEQIDHDIEAPSQWNTAGAGVTRFT